MRYDIINYSIVVLTMLYRVLTALRIDGVSGRQHARYLRSIAQLNDTYYFEMGDGAVSRRHVRFLRRVTS